MAAGSPVSMTNAFANTSSTQAGPVKKAAARADDATAIPAAAPAGGTGAAAGGWDTAVNRDAAITTINGLRTNVTNLQTAFNDLLAKLRTAGILTS